MTSCVDKYQNYWIKCPREPRFWRTVEEVLGWEFIDVPKTVPSALHGQMIKNARKFPIPILIEAKKVAAAALDRELSGDALAKVAGDAKVASDALEEIAIAKVGHVRVALVKETLLQPPVRTTRAQRSREVCGQPIKETEADGGVAAL